MPGPKHPIILTVAGSDSGGGAGIQADLKTFQAHQAYGTSVVTALTAQNTLGVQGIHVVPADFVRKQWLSVTSDLPPAAVKTGMLGTAELVLTVAELLTAYPRPVVIDPVMVATSGHVLLAPDALTALQEHLLPRATVITPNAHEAALLTGIAITSAAAALEAALALHGRYPQAAVLVKGGHWGTEATDTLVTAGAVVTFTTPRLATTSTHGTGCILAAAIAARLAQGHTVRDSVALAKAYLLAALRAAPGLGQGAGPLWHAVTPPEDYAAVAVSETPR